MVKGVRVGGGFAAIAVLIRGVSSMTCVVRRALQVHIAFVLIITNSNALASRVIQNACGLVVGVGSENVPARTC